MRLLDYMGQIEPWDKNPSEEISGPSAVCQPPISRPGGREGSLTSHPFPSLPHPQPSG